MNNESNTAIALVSVLNLDQEKKMTLPVGLIYLGSALRKHGYRVKLFHLVQRKEEVRQVEKEIIEMNPLFVGFSVFMGPGSVTSLEMSKRIKGALGVKIVWGGKYVTSIADAVIAENCVDVVCLGEGEEVIVELAQAFERENGLEDIKGIGCKQNGAVTWTGQRALIQDLDSLDYDFRLIDNWNRYITTQEGKLAVIDSMESQRGCLFRCNFCYQNSEMFSREGKKVVRSHSVGWILEKASVLKELTGTEYISFCDDEFWIRRERSFDIIDGLYKMNLKLYKLRMRIGNLKNEEMIERLLKYEVNVLGFGLESGVDRILGLMDKRQTRDLILSKIRLLAKYPQMRIGALVIVGSPTETREEVVDSVRFALKLCEECPGFVFGLIPYQPTPQTKFFKMIVGLGFKEPRTVTEWADVERKSVHKIMYSWIPWFNKREELAFQRMFYYIDILSYGRRPDRSKMTKWKSSFLSPRSIVISLLGALARHRLYYWNFGFPIEAYLLRVYRYVRGLKNGKSRHTWSS